MPIRRSARWHTASAAASAGHGGPFLDFHDVGRGSFCAGEPPGSVARVLVNRELRQRAARRRDVDLGQPWIGRPAAHLLDDLVDERSEVALAEGVGPQGALTVRLDLPAIDEAPECQRAGVLAPRRSPDDVCLIEDGPLYAEAFELGAGPLLLDGSCSVLRSYSAQPAFRVLPGERIPPWPGARELPGIRRCPDVRRRVDVAVAGLDFDEWRAVQQRDQGCLDGRISCVQPLDDMAPVAYPGGNLAQPSRSEALKRVWSVRVLVCSLRDPTRPGSPPLPSARRCGGPGRRRGRRQCRGAVLPDRCRCSPAGRR